MRQRAALLSAITLALVSSSVLAVPVPSGAASGIDQRDSPVFKPIAGLSQDNPVALPSQGIPGPVVGYFVPRPGFSAPSPQPSSPPLELTLNGFDGNRSTCDGLQCNPVGRRDEPAPLIRISLPKTGGVDQRDTEQAKEPASFAGAFVPHPKAIGQRDTPEFTQLTGLPPPTQSFTPIIPTSVPFDPSAPPPSPSSPPGESVPNGKDSEGKPTCDDLICNPLGRRDEPAPLILISVPKTGGVDQRDTPRSDAFVREPEPLILISRPKTGGVDQRDIQNAMADMVKRSIEELD